MQEDHNIVFWKDGKPGDQPTISGRLAIQQKGRLKYSLGEVCPSVSNQPGCTSLAEHKIEMGLARPVRLSLYRIPQAYRAEVEKELKEMLSQGIIESSYSEWAAPIVLVKKRMED